MSAQPQPVVIGIGRTSIDFLGVTDGFPAPDTKKEFETFSIQGGGPAATAMVTVQRLGLQTAFIGKVGDDFFGKFMIDSLCAESVQTSNVVVVPDCVSQFACISIDKVSGGRTILWTNGTVPLMTIDELPERLPASIRAIHVDGHHIDAAAELARVAKQQGAVIAYDAGSVRPGVEKLVALTDLLVTTRRFALDYTGAKDIYTALRELKKVGARIAAITLGISGSIATDGSETVQIGAYPVHAVDTTGAGDVYHGAFLFAYLSGWNLCQIVSFSNAVAALKCTQLGGRPGIPRLNAAFEFMKTTQPSVFFDPDQT